MIGKKGDIEADGDLRDNENIELPVGIIELSDDAREAAVKKLAQEHLVKEIHPFISDAWIDHSKTKIGYEIPFTRQFYTFTTPRPVAEIRTEIEMIEVQILELMKGLASVVTSPDGH